MDFPYVSNMVEKAWKGIIKQGLRLLAEQFVQFGIFFL